MVKKIKLNIITSPEKSIGHIENSVSLQIYEADKNIFEMKKELKL